MRVHKSLLIHWIREHPEDLGEHLPDWKGTAEEAIEELEKDPRQYLDEFQGEEK